MLLHGIVVLFIFALHIVLCTGMDSSDNTGHYPAEKTGSATFSQ